MKHRFEYLSATGRWVDAKDTCHSDMPDVDYDTEEQAQAAADAFSTKRAGVPVRTVEVVETAKRFRYRLALKGRYFALDAETLDAIRPVLYRSPASEISEILRRAVQAGQAEEIPIR